MAVSKKKNFTKKWIVLVVVIFLGCSTLLLSFAVNNLNNVITSIEPINKNIEYQEFDNEENFSKANFPSTLNGLTKNKKLEIKNVVWKQIKKEDLGSTIKYTYKPIINESYKVNKDVNLPIITIVVSKFKTVISNIEDLEIFYNETPNKSIKINSVPGRNGELQYLDNNNWVTKNKFILDKKENDVKLLFSDDWKNSEISKWRIFLPKTEFMDEFISNEFTIKIKPLDVHVKGIENITSPKNLEITKKLNIENGFNKNLQLETFNSESHNWDTIDTYKLNSESNILEINIRNWVPNSKWRVTIPKDYKSNKFVSDTFKINVLDTSISKVPKELSGQTGEYVKTDLSINVALGRTVYLQKKVNNNWVNVSEYKTENSIIDKITVKIPLNKDKIDSNYYRLYMKESKFGKEYASNKILVNTTNNTQVKNLKTSYQKTIGELITNTVTVSPAFKRPIYLEYFNSSKNKWEIKNTFLTEDTKSSQVKLIYPNTWEEKQNTKWRVRIPKSNNSNEYIKEINIIAKPVYQIPSKYLQITDNIYFNGGGYNLVKGTMGLKVLKVQKKLGIKSDRAIIDNKMIAEIKIFQQKNGLTPDGIVGLSTWKKMGFSENDWYHLGTYVTPKKTNPRSTRKDYIEAMINTAISYLGTDYVIGASGKPGTGIDCSGLVMQGMYAAGINPLPVSVVRHSQPGYEYESYFLWNHPKLKHVKYSERERGDLIFYKNEQGNLSHVAIYLGNDQVIESYPPKVVIWPIKNNERSIIMGVVRVFP